MYSMHFKKKEDYKVSSRANQETAGRAGHDWIKEWTQSQHTVHVMIKCGHSHLEKTDFCFMSFWASKSEVLFGKWHMLCMSVKIYVKSLAKHRVIRVYYQFLLVPITGGFHLT